MIYTVTLNPIIDRTLTVEHFRIGGTFKAAHSDLLPAGKGVNVARVVATLGVPVAALGLVGQHDAAIFAEALAQAKVENRLIPVPGATRTSVTILDPAQHTETHLREPGSTPPLDALERVATELECLAPGDWVAFAGSLPPGLPVDTYRNLLRLCARHDAHTLLDTNGPALLSGAYAPPTVLKPNLFELWQIDRHRADGTAEQQLDMVPLPQILNAARRAQERTCSMVIVTMGKRGIVGLDRQGQAWRAQTTLHRPAVNAVGSGDALAGGLIVALARDDPFPEALRLGVACGAANALIPGAGRCQKDDIEELFRRASVEALP